MNQEVYGGPVTREFLEGLFLPDFIINQMYINGTYYHPTFLYESVWNLLGVFLLLYLRRVNLRQGELFLSYVIWYSVGRFFIEGIRLDYLLIGGFLKTAQVISVVLVIGSIVLWIYRRKQPNTPRYLDRAISAKKRKTKEEKVNSLRQGYNERWFRWRLCPTSVAYQRIKYGGARVKSFMTMAISSFRE